MASSRRPLLLMDANVLIDFCDSDRTVIPLISKHIGRVHVAMPILLEEVEQFKDFDWTELGIVGVEPSLELATQAAQRRAGLSFHDQLCLFLARDNGWTCVTNDGRLRRECADEGIATLWGLEVIALLVEDAVLAVEVAEGIGRAIHAANPKFITTQILDRFLKRIGAAGPRTKR